MFTKKFRIETDRLLLRKITLSDAEDMFEYACRSDVTEFLLWDPHPSYSYTVELIRHLQRGYTEEKYFEQLIYGIRFLETYQNIKKPEK